MRYFAWTTNLSAADCFCVWALPGDFTEDDLLARGKLAARFPADATIAMRKTPPARRALKSCIAHPSGLVLASRAVQAAIEAVCAPGEVELLPFTLVNDRGKEVSRDYAIVRPLKTVACLHRRSGEAGLVLDGAKLGAATPHLFRLARPAKLGGRSVAVLSQVLARRFKDEGFENLFLAELPVEPAAG
jgi:hypothetical protein